jgi:nicotinamide mononucleotide adenylyltransferase
MTDIKRSLTEQYVYKRPNLGIDRTYSENRYTLPTPQGISVEGRDIKIAQLKDFINNAAEINDGKDNYTADEIVTQDNSGKEAKFFYFIGRLNPPHNGHIKALETLVELANEQNSVPLILLGSGPGGERTLDNPITFETKSAFISRILNSMSEPPPRYIIRKMTNPAKNISEYITEGLQEKDNKLENIEEVRITHIAGGKDEDTTKLAFALKSAEKTARELVPEANIVTGVEAIDAETTDSGVAMSATKVRKDAYKTVLDKTGFLGWPEQYKQFYGPDAEQIYLEILEPLNSMPEEEKKSVVTNYIEKGVLPSIKKRKRGGTKRKNKNKKKTHRKRRISRRIYRRISRRKY